MPIGLGVYNANKRKKESEASRREMIALSRQPKVQRKKTSYDPAKAR